MTEQYGPSLEISEQTHASKYRGEGEAFSEGCARFSNTLADNQEHFRALNNILLNMRFMGGGRTQAAIGAPRNVTAFNCFVSGTIEDSMDDIMGKASEAAQTMRLGGGIGYGFSNLRPRGDRIVSLGSKSSGPITFMDIYNSVCKTISSAGHRRGAQMGVLRVDHPDIEEFVRAKQNETELRQFNLSIGVTDEFMEAVENDSEFDLEFDGQIYETVNARFLYEEIMRSTWDWAEPGFLLIDTINKWNNLHYCETIEATNPCLHPDSLIETGHGRVKIKDIKEPTLVYTMLDDGSLGLARASAAFKTKTNAKTLKITVGSGKSITCTPDHKIYVDGVGWTEAQDLQYGDKLVHLCRARRGVGYSGVKLSTEGNRAYQMEHRMILNAVAGLYDDEDVHHIDGNTYNNTISNLHILGHGQHPTVTRNECSNDHQVKGEGGRYINTSSGYTKPIIEMPEELKSNLKNQYSSCITSIEEGPTADVYDLTVEGTHNFIADFIVVHNCGEQPLPPYGACLLGSYNLVKYIKPSGNVGTAGHIDYDKQTYTFNWEQLKQDIPHIVRAMDNIIDNTTYPLEAQETEAKNKRRMGLGVTGVANAGEILGMPYASPEFMKWFAEVMEVIRDETYGASVELAKEKGAFPLFDSVEYGKGLFIKSLPAALQRKIKKYGIRNSHLLSVAPTGTISLCADNVSSGIEPVFAYTTNRTIQTFDGPTNVIVEDYAYREYGVEGKTVEDCTADDHLRVLATAQKYVDSAVSKTINVSPDISWEDFKDIYIKAWKLGCKGVTTFNPSGMRFGILNKVEEKEEEDKPVEACYIDVSTGNKECS